MNLFDLADLGPIMPLHPCPVCSYQHRRQSPWCGPECAMIDRDEKCPIRHNDDDDTRVAWAERVARPVITCACGRKGCTRHGLGV